LSLSEFVHTRKILPYIFAFQEKKSMYRSNGFPFFLLHVHIEELTILDLLGGSGVG